MSILSKRIDFPTHIPHGCIKGRASAHAHGVEVTYFQSTTFPAIDIESVNSWGGITTNCRIPLPNNPDVLRALGDYLEELAKEIENGA